MREKWAEGGREGGDVFQREGGRDRGRLLQREGGRVEGREEGGRERGREREGSYYKEREGGMEGITRVV